MAQGSKGPGPRRPRGRGKGSKDLIDVPWRAGAREAHAVRGGNMVVEYILVLTITSIGLDFRDTRFGIVEAETV
jgi:hypothetical protein